MAEKKTTTCFETWVIKRMEILMTEQRSWGEGKEEGDIFERKGKEEAGFSLRRHVTFKMMLKHPIGNV